MTEPTPTLEEYILAHSDKEPQYLHDIWRRTNLRKLAGRMCSGHLQGRLLKMLVQIASATRVLELGTFSGYATICLAEGLPEGGVITTIEHDDEMEDFIRENLALANVAEKVDLRIGDATEIMESLPENSFDLIFMDADKRQYPEYYLQAKRLIKDGGLILADNTLWDGHVVEPEHSRDPQTAGILRFNRMVAEDPQAEKVILPLRDGLTLIRIRKPSGK